MKGHIFLRMCPTLYLSRISVFVQRCVKHKLVLNYLISHFSAFDLSMFLLAVTLYGLLLMWTVAYMDCTLYGLLLIWTVAYVDCTLCGLLLIWTVAYVD